MSDWDKGYVNPNDIYNIGSPAWEGARHRQRQEEGWAAALKANQPTSSTPSYPGYSSRVTPPPPPPPRTVINSTPEPTSRPAPLPPVEPPPVQLELFPSIAEPKIVPIVSLRNHDTKRHPLQFLSEVSAFDWGALAALILLGSAGMTYFYAIKHHTVPTEEELHQQQAAAGEAAQKSFEDDLNRMNPSPIEIVTTRISERMPQSKLEHYLQTRNMPESALPADKNGVRVSSYRISVDFKAQALSFIGSGSRTLQPDCLNFKFLVTPEKEGTAYKNFRQTACFKNGVWVQQSARP